MDRCVPVTKYLKNSVTLLGYEYCFTDSRSHQINRHCILIPYIIAFKIDFPDDHQFMARQVPVFLRGNNIATHFCKQQAY